jgi:hypothetical protein
MAFPRDGDTVRRPPGIQCMTPDPPSLLCGIVAGMWRMAEWNLDVAARAALGL